MKLSFFLDLKIQMEFYHPGFWLEFPLYTWVKQGTSMGEKIAPRDRLLAGLLYLFMRYLDGTAPAREREADER